MDEAMIRAADELYVPAADYSTDLSKNHEVRLKEAAIIQKKLLRWFEQHARQLPWRETSDPYAVWVSEVMLQQTQVNTVIPYYHRFLERFPAIGDLAASDQESVLKLWEGLGYYARARNLHKAAQVVWEDYGGSVPGDWKELKKLPGIGDYIASAVASIAFGLPHAVVDGNVKRVLARLFLMPEEVNHSPFHRIFQEKATELLGTAPPAAFNQAMMELGALVCKPAGPACDVCPVSGECRAFREDGVDGYPRRMQKKKTPTYAIAAGVVRKKGRLLITRRKPEGLLGGLWEFPGGKIKEGEDAEAACLREIKEETGIDASADHFLMRVHHAYTHFKIEMDVFLCRYLSGEVCLNGPVDYRWIRPEEIGDYPFPKANHKFIPELLRRLPELP